MMWKCKEGHIWETTFGCVYNGKWCPICSVGKSQIKCANILSKLLNKTPKQNFRPKWLTNPKTNYPLEIDVYFPELKIAVEYNGAQHYKPVTLGGCSKKTASKIFKGVQQRDRIKKELIDSQPDKVRHFIIIKYTEKLTEENLTRILLDAGVSLTRINEL